MVFNSSGSHASLVALVAGPKAQETQLAKCLRRPMTARNWQMPCSASFEGAQVYEPATSSSINSTVTWLKFNSHAPITDTTSTTIVS